MTQLSQPPVAVPKVKPQVQRVRGWITNWRRGVAMRSLRCSSRLIERPVTAGDGPDEEVAALQTNLFPLGRVVITASAHTRLSEQTVLASLVRHANGDWGEVCEKTAAKTNSRLSADSDFCRCTATSRKPPSGSSLKLIAQRQRF